MKTPEIRGENVEPMLETKFLRVFDLRYAEGKHYYDATRRQAGELAAVKDDEAFRNMLPDAVTCVVIVCRPAEEPVLLLSYEYRYPAGRFLLSPPAGLLDPDDRAEAVPAFAAAKREIREETGLEVTDRDRLFFVSPLVFSSPGMTDESNALVCAVLSRDALPQPSQAGAVGTECFDGFEWVTAAQAEKLLADGRDRNGFFYSVYTWAALSYFAAGTWKKRE